MITKNPDSTDTRYIVRQVSGIKLVA